MTTTDFVLPPHVEDPSLAAAYELPAYLPESFRELHAEVIERMKQEARTVSMSTVQNMLIATIAYNFVQMKYLESIEEAGTRSYATVRDTWLKMTVEFNRLLTASESKSRTTLLVEVQNILRNSLKTVKDPVEKQALAQMWSEEFARVDL